MSVLFVMSALVAVVSTAMVITRTNVIHALLYLILSLLAVAVVFYLLGAPFVAALEIIIYAGAIMVLFVFAVIILNIGAGRQAWPRASVWIGPAVLAAILLGEMIYVLCRGGPSASAGSVVDPKQVGLSLFGPYMLAVELASFLLLAGLVGAYHLGRGEDPGRTATNQTEPRP